ncbi:MAG TPA: FIST N-terminal domain-containing protein [Phycisphaerae bacterium]|nr:FIST N-terminal domain-containing protein [Phycisphaerae bacterium]
MRIASALSTLDSTAEIWMDLERQLKDQLAGESVDVLLVFVSADWAPAFQLLITPLKAALEPQHFMAVIAESVIGTDQEIERMRAVSALALSLPGATLNTFHLAEEEWGDLLTDDEEFRRRLTPEDIEAEELRAFLFIADPFTTPIVQLLDASSRVFPAAPVIGGMSSGVKAAGETRLALDDAVHTSGLIGMSFSGNIEVDTVVSQGCRPIGCTFAITRCHKNVIEELDGKPALTAIEQMVSTLPVHDRQLLATGGLQIGRVIDEGKGNYGRGDFLIRSLVGVRRDTGAILIGDMVQTGETLQFHVRDAKTAEEEMRLLLEGETLLTSADPPLGALLITCNGRGTRLFDMPHHDVSLTRQVLGAIPVAGFFAAGELGPVGQKNFIHGHTAVLALFRQPETAE